MTENQKQREYWSGVVGRNWVERQDIFEKGFTHITAALMDFAALVPGMNVLDIGCGAGSTTLAIAKAVAPGKAVGIDISAPLIASAKERARAANSPAEFIEADASDHPFAPEFDLAFSRFGVMFFADPVRSFGNIRKALKPGGRLAFICWCPFEESASVYEPYAAARDLLPPEEPVKPHAPGPFGLADSKRTFSILTHAGYAGITIERVERPSLMGATVDEAVEQAMNLGPLAFATRNSDDATKGAVRIRIRPVLERFGTSEGIAPPAAFWRVGALSY
jgi:SAM-dependent methyltransferase